MRRITCDEEDRDILPSSSATAAASLLPVYSDSDSRKMLYIMTLGEFGSASYFSTVQFKLV